MKARYFRSAAEFRRWLERNHGREREITVGFYLADMSDSILATVALLDNFRWDCEGCIPSEVEDCGVQPM